MKTDCLQTKPLLRDEWEAKFSKLWTDCGGESGAEVFQRLRDRYVEESRAYHNLIHIANCLGKLGAEPVSPEIAMAIWFHDVIYDSRRKDNEEQSAQYFQKEAAHLSPTFVAEVCRLIRVTVHHRATADDEAFLCDIDLGILGTDPDSYAEYVKAIRKEYDWVEEAHWKAGRALVLRNFLERPLLYLTPAFQKLEVPARTNLLHELHQLEAGQVAQTESVETKSPATVTLPGLV